MDILILAHTAPSRKFHFEAGCGRERVLGVIVIFCVLKLKMDQWDLFKDLVPNHDDKKYLLNIGEEVNNNQDNDLVNIGEEVNDKLQDHLLDITLQDDLLNIEEEVNNNHDDDLVNIGEEVNDTLQYDLLQDDLVNIGEEVKFMNW